MTPSLDAATLHHLVGELERIESPIGDQVIDLARRSGPGLTSADLRNPHDFLVHVVLNEGSHLFELWLALGAVLAAPVFASSVVAIPALLDQPPQRLGVFGAVLTSWRVVLEHPAPIALWAALLMGLTLIGMATALLGLVVILPWLGHASWHAYRGTVDWSTETAAP